MVKDDVVIKCWGRNIEKNKIVIKNYLSYIVRDLEDIEKYYDKDLHRFTHAEIILNQQSNEITLDLYSNDGEEKIITTKWNKSIFYEIIFNIEEKIKSKVL